MAEDLHAGQVVKFKLGDIHLPDLGEVVARMTGDTELHGSITLLSDHGESRSAFAVVEVPGILMPLILPASCVRIVGEAGEQELPTVRRPSAAGRVG